MQQIISLLAFVVLAVAQKSLDIDVPQAVEILNPLPLDVAKPLPSKFKQESIEGAVFDIPQPSLSLMQPSIEMSKGAPEIHDVPHANIAFPGNTVLDKKLVLNIPSPIIEAPKPIVQTKPVLFKLPQVIIQLPSPVIQHKPIIYKVPHTLIINTPEVNLKKYHIPIPKLKIIKSHKKSIPEGYKPKSAYGPVSEAVAIEGAIEGAIKKQFDHIKGGLGGFKPKGAHGLDAIEGALKQKFDHIKGGLGGLKPKSAHGLVAIEGALKQKFDHIKGTFDNL